MSFSDLAPAEQWLIDLLKARKRKILAVASPDPLVALDSDIAIAKAIDYLKTNAPEAFEGAGGDGVTYQVACRLRDFGLSKNVAFDLLAEHWNEADKAHPPWSADDLMQKVENAFAYSTGAWGGALGVAEFDDATSTLKVEAPAKQNRRLFAVSLADSARLALEASPPALISGLIDQETLVVVYGPSNSGKTFVVIDMSLHVAAGIPWVGRPVTPGLVIYVSAEGGRNIHKRTAAWVAAHPGAASAPFVVVPCPIDLLRGTDAKALVDLIKEQEAATSMPARLVVIDTLARALAGGDENSSTDMGNLIRNIDRTRESVRATFLLVHHTGKDAARGSRGWSGLLGAIDTEIEIEPKAHLVGVIHNTKQRDMPKAADLPFRLEAVNVGRTSAGDTVSSNIVRVLAGGEFLKLELAGRDAEFFEALESAAQIKAEALGTLERWQDTAVTWAEWVKAFEDSLSGFDQSQEQKVSQFPTETVSRSRANLLMRRKNVVDAGYARKTSNNQWVIV